MEKSGYGPFQFGNVLDCVSKKFKLKDIKWQQELLTIWYDLFRTGLIAPGYDLSNLNLPFFHFTEKGRKSVLAISRDPSNPDGYMRTLQQISLNDTITLSYTEEAIKAYLNDCAKAAAVMIGCASERLVLIVRDELTAGLLRKNRPIPNTLSDWRYKTVRDAISLEIDSQKSALPNKLRDSYTSFWMPCTEQMRQHRNDAGHPQSVSPVTNEIVHANLLLFPTFADLALQLVGWISNHYK